MPTWFEILNAERRSYLEYRDNLGDARFDEIMRSIDDAQRYLEANLRLDRQDAFYQSADVKLPFAPVDMRPDRPRISYRWLFAIMSKGAIGRWDSRVLAYAGFIQERSWEVVGDEMRGQLHRLRAIGIDPYDVVF